MGNCTVGRQRKPLAPLRLEGSRKQACGHPRWRDTCAEALGRAEQGAHETRQVCSWEWALVRACRAAFTCLRTLGLALEMGAEESSSVTQV